MGHGQYNKYVVDPKPYKAMDGSYQGTMGEVEKTNELYWDKVMELLTYPNKNLPLAPTQLEQISLNPSVATLVSVLHQVIQQQLNKANEKSKHI